MVCRFGVIIREKRGPVNRKEKNGVPQQKNAAFVS